MKDVKFRTNQLYMLVRFDIVRIHEIRKEIKNLRHRRIPAAWKSVRFLHEAAPDDHHVASLLRRLHTFYGQIIQMQVELKELQSFVWEHRDELYQLRKMRRAHMAKKRRQ